MGGGGGITDDIINVVAAAIGNTVGGPLGAAGTDFLANELEGHGTKGSLEGAALSGATSGIGDLATGASLTGGGISGLTNAVSNISDTASNFFSGGTPTTAASGVAGDGSVPGTGNTNLFGSGTTGTGAASTPFGGASSSTTAAPAGIAGAGADATSSVDTSSLSNFNSDPSANVSSSASSPSSVSQNASTPSANTGSTSSPSAPSGTVSPFDSASSGASAATGPANVAAGDGGQVGAALGSDIASAENSANPSVSLGNLTQGAQGIGASSAQVNNGGVIDSFTGGSTYTPSGSFQGSTSIANAASPVSGTAAPSGLTQLVNAYNGTEPWSQALGANAGTLLSGAGLIGDVALNHGELKGQKQLSNEAGSLAAQGQSLQQYLQTGTLPAGLQGALNSATDNAIATIKSQYAARGMSGSSAEQDAIAQAQENAQASGSQMALQLLQTGVSESEGASQLYQSIMNSALQQDEQLGSAIGRFATSAAGGAPQSTISVNGKNVTV